MSLVVCVIDTDNALLYEWSGALTINIYDARTYTDHREDGSLWQGGLVDAYMLAGPDNPSAEDFIASVVEHTKGVSGD